MLRPRCLFFCSLQRCDPYSLYCAYVSLELFIRCLSFTGFPQQWTTANRAAIKEIKQRTTNERINFNQCFVTANSYIMSKLFIYCLNLCIYCMKVQLMMKTWCHYMLLHTGITNKLGSCQNSVLKETVFVCRWNQVQTFVSKPCWMVHVIRDGLRWTKTYTCKNEQTERLPALVSGYTLANSRETC